MFSNTILYSEFLLIPPLLVSILLVSIPLVSILLVSILLVSIPLGCARTSGVLGPICAYSDRSGHVWMTALGLTFVDVRSDEL
jgi:hypothetical protein